MQLTDSNRIGTETMPDMFPYHVALGLFENCSRPPQQIIMNKKADPMYRGVDAKGQNMLKKSLPTSVAWS